VESMGYGVTVAKIFDAKGLTAKILKAQELARGLTNMLASYRLFSINTQ